MSLVHYTINHYPIYFTFDRQATSSSVFTSFPDLKNEIVRYRPEYRSLTSGVLQDLILDFNRMDSGHQGVRRSIEIDFPDVMNDATYRRLFQSSIMKSEPLFNSLGLNVVTLTYQVPALHNFTTLNIGAGDKAVIVDHSSPSDLHSVLSIVQHILRKRLFRAIGIQAATINLTVTAESISISQTIRIADTVVIGVSSESATVNTSVIITANSVSVLPVAETASVNVLTSLTADTISVSITAETATPSVGQIIITADTISISNISESAQVVVGEVTITGDTISVSMTAESANVIINVVTSSLATVTITAETAAVVTGEVSITASTVTVTSNAKPADIPEFIVSDETGEFLQAEDNANIYIG